MGERGIERVFRGQRTMDGAGVSLERVFGYRERELMDPFLLLDAFGSTREEEYIAGFPWHPHRGIETVTYLLEGSVRHGDSLGNSGTIGPGDIQWMTAGSGIIHEEMPQPSPGGVKGFQLWVNLARSEKMRKPAYRDALGTSIPELRVGEAKVKLIAGKLGGERGPIGGVSRDPDYFDIGLPPGGSASFEAPAARRVFAYLFEGSLEAPATPPGAAILDASKAGLCILFGPGEGVALRAGPVGARLILVQGEPLREPIAWRGPIVMNSEEELDLAFEEYARGTFVKEGARPAAR